MTHNVTVGEFEGPLGILLELVERHKLEVTSISVAKITAEYLEQIRRLQTHSPDELSEFLQLGARLLYIKSLALLPPESSAEQGEELRQLSLELEDYRRFQAAARSLAKRAATPTWERQFTPSLEPHERPLPDLQLPQLAEAFTRALKQATPTPAPSLIRQHISLEAVLAQLRKRLDAGFALQTALDRCHDRLEIIVTFLALLELIREGAARVSQASQFAPIQVEATRA